jgi:threonine/homoserine/homoserine lactone efflux protein
MNLLTAALEGIHHWPVFITAGLLLNITPGADMALIARHAATSGFKAGAAAALGVGAGCWVHTAAAALGLSALVAASATAFAALRWMGAAYLVWLGWTLLRNQPGTVSGGPTIPTGGWQRVFMQGFLTNALNPKVALFFLAFVPQFIRPDTPHQWLAFIVLGTVFVVNSTALNLGLAWMVAHIRQGLGERRGLQRLGLWLNRSVGAVFVALGAALALGTSPTPG